MKGILGRKVGMTSVFNKDGKLVPVTVIEVEPNVISQIKTKEKDGYDAIQLAFGNMREKLINKPGLGHLKKANTTPKRFLKEIRGVTVSDYSIGMEIKADLFAEGEMVDVTGTSKGKGFEGVIKRYNQTRGPMGHGSQYHRGVGSMGTMLTMRVLPGKKLPGHMGHQTVTIQNLEIIATDLENNIILIKGNVPGAKKTLVMIRSAIKNPDKINNRFDILSYDETTIEELNANLENSDEMEDDIQEVISEEENVEAVSEEVADEVQVEEETTNENSDEENESSQENNE